MIPKKAVNTRFKFFLLPNASLSGAVARSPSSRIRQNSGLSASLARIHTEIASSTAEARNGMRQPQVANASSPTEVRVATITSSAASSPNDADD